MKKIALVTGANRGIGLEIAKELAEGGFQVWMAGRKKEKIEKAAASIKGEVFPIVLDLLSMESLESTAQTLEKELPHLDVLVNNAGINQNASFLEADWKTFQQIIQTNYLGPVYLTKLLLPLLQKSPEGRIINMSSGMGAHSGLASGGYAAYRMSKANLNDFTIQLAADLRNTSVKVNAMHPGWVATDMGGKSAPKSIAQGADTAVWLATADQIPSGKFFENREERSW